MSLSESAQTPLLDKGLKELIQTKQSACVYLKNGIKLTGNVLEFDSSSIRLAGQTEFGLIIQRSAVASLQPQSPERQKA